MDSGEDSHMGERQIHREENRNGMMGIERGGKMDEPINGKGTKVDGERNKKHR